MPADLSLQQANRLLGRLGGYLGRCCDGEPGAESLAIGLRRLADMTWGWKLGTRKSKRRCV